MAAELQGKLRSNRFFGELTVLLLLQFLGSSEGIGEVDQKLSQLAGWSWEGIGHCKKGWELPMEGLGGQSPSGFDITKS